MVKAWEGQVWVEGKRQNKGDSCNTINNKGTLKKMTLDFSIATMKVKGQWVNACKIQRQIQWHSNCRYLENKDIFLDMQNL